MGTRPERTPEIGALIAWEHAVYRVREIRGVPRDLWSNDDHHGEAPKIVVVRPARLTGDDPKLRNQDVHLRASWWALWDVYPDEHYPVCATCGDPAPCREQVAARDTAVAAAQMTKFEIPGVCPSCQEPVTSRQKSRTFVENVRVPLGPPVTFHERARCREGLWAFEDVWVAQDPGQRVSTRPPVCRGHVVVHVGSRTYECSEGQSCPGAEHEHRSWRACGCPEHPGGFGREDLAGARNLAAPDGAA